MTLASIVLAANQLEWRAARNCLSNLNYFFFSHRTYILCSFCIHYLKAVGNLLIIILSLFFALENHYSDEFVEPTCRRLSSAANLLLKIGVKSTNCAPFCQIENHHVSLTRCQSVNEVCLCFASFHSCSNHPPSFDVQEAAVRALCICLPHFINGSIDLCTCTGS